MTNEEYLKTSRLRKGIVACPEAKKLLREFIDTPVIDRTVRGLVNHTNTCDVCKEAETAAGMEEGQK